MRVTLPCGLETAVHLILKSILSLFAGGFLLGAARPAEARDEKRPEVNRRPRIGLVLSGGGARGGAHVGVLEVLERLRIPVDYVAGTSIGSIIGGLYASGMSPAEMSRALETIDWNAAIKDSPPRYDIPYRDKEDDPLYQIKAELRMQGLKPVFPTGLISGQNLIFYLRRFTYPALGVVDFDQLPIPFRAVASNVENNEMVVLGKGDLVRAMRASMALPGIFSAVDLDGKLLTDGGVVRNLPVDAVREMGADIVIAVDVSTPLYKRDEIDSFLAIADQTTGFLTRLNVLDQIKTLTNQDILLTPELTGIGTISFEKFAIAIERGRAAAEKSDEKLEALSVSEEEWSRFLSRQRRPLPENPSVDEIRVAPSERQNEEYLLRFTQSRPGPVDWEKLHRDMGRIYASGQFTYVDFRLETSGGRTILSIDPRPRVRAPVQMRFGLTFGTSFAGDSHFDVSAGIRSTNLNRLRGEWKIQLAAGELTQLATEFYQPLDGAGKFFVLPRVEWTRTPFDVYRDGENIAQYRVDRFAGKLFMGYSMGPLGEVRAGYERSRIDSTLKVGLPLHPDLRSGRAGLSTSIVLDQLDSVSQPRDGWYANASYFSAARSLGSDDTYQSLSVLGLAARSFGENTLTISAQYRGPVKGRLPYYDASVLGGLLKLSGLAPGELTGEASLLGRAVYHRRLAQLPSLLGSGIYAGGSLEAGNVWANSSDVSVSDLIFAGSLFVSADTVLGPLYFAAGRAEGGKTRLYLSLGLPLE